MKNIFVTSCDLGKVEVKNMRKKIMLGSVVVALLMLVSTQIVILNTVRSDPELHAGDAVAGSLWISELNVSSCLQTIDNIGISHANATDDWVLWENGEGSINASWSVDIDDDHPEYYVLFGLTVYNIDDDNNVIGNDTFVKTYNANTNYDESGTLSTYIEFTRDQQQAGSQTLVCYLDSQVILNDTVEATNFTSWGQDRCVVAVDFIPPIGTPDFSVYRDEANEGFPSLWSYINGWNESGRFDDEDDMLNNQTFFKIGSASVSSTSTSGNLWDLGDADVWRDGNLQANVDFKILNNAGQDEYTIDPDGTKLITDVKVDYEILTIGIPPYAAIMSYRLRRENGQYANDFDCWFWSIFTDYPTGTLETTIEAYTTDDTNDDGKVKITGWFTAAVFKGGTNVKMIDLPIQNYYIVIGEGEGEPVDVEHEYCNWEELCAYHNESYNIPISSNETSGITTIEAYISEILITQSIGECVYTFSGDRGDTRIELTC